MNDELIEFLAERSHIGWMKEKQAQGFADHAWRPCDCRWETTPAIGCHTDDCVLPRNKHHADMKPYADLAENVREYDRATVRQVLGGLDAAGYRVVKAND